MELCWNHPRTISDRKRAEALDQAEQMAQSERLFSLANDREHTWHPLFITIQMKTSSAGIRKFRNVSGYSGEEIAADATRAIFFRNEEIARLEERIAEVFATGNLLLRRRSGPKMAL